MENFQSVSIFLLLVLVCLPQTRAMDLDLGDGTVLTDLPCVKRFNQLYCTGTGAAYPQQAISTYTDDNKALLRRMFGEMQEPVTVTQTTVRIVQTFSNIGFVAAPLVKGQFAAGPTQPAVQPAFQRFRRDVLEGTWEEMAERAGNTTEGRARRQAEFPGDPEQDNTKDDVCESKIEVSTPFWASNSNGKVRAILNNKEFEQAVHQEICTAAATLRCARDCSCEQKYKWHRLLAYDPNNDCAGIFMDWFLFPSCCVCRCNKNPFLG